MVAPSSTGSSLDILLKFSMDPAANERVKNGVSTLAEELKKLEGAFPGEDLGKETEKFNEKLKETEKTAKQTAATLRAEAKVLSTQAADIVSGFQKAQISTLRTISSQIQTVSRNAILAGGGLLGGALALASKYVADAEQATAVTVRWKAASEDLKDSQSRIGAVLAEQSLPLLEKAAELADKATDFIEGHPDIVSAALNAGKILVTLGIAGTLVSKGIKLVADVKYLATIPAQLAAAKLQDEAATKQLAAAQLRLKDIGGALPGASKVPSLLNLGPLAAILAGGAGFTALGRGAANFGAKQFGFESPEDFWKQTFEALGLVKTASDAASTSLGKVAADLGSVKFSPQFDQILKAYEDYKRDDLEATQQHYADRRQIISEALASEKKVNEDYASNVAKVRSQTTKALSDAASQFAEANKKAEIDYQQSRAQIVRDGNQGIEQLQRDLQERLRKNEEEHQNRVADLTASRDALGLAKERQRFTQEQAEARRDTGQEIKQRRAEIAQRLADLAQSYEQERAQRLADQQARIAEIQQQAAERLAELAKERAEELRQIQVQKVAKIRELDTQFVEERKRRYQYFIQQIRDLDASLLGEKRLKDKYNVLMIQDLDKFLAAYRAKLGSLAAAVPGRADGGYTAGLVRTGERGYEYVMSHDTTRAAEGVIGGRLTQQGLLAALQGMGGGGSGVVWNDQRRFSGEYTNAMREMVRKDTRAVLRRELQ
jgi:hypothetical protein